MMMKNIRKKKGDKKGFTLVELIVVLVILAILAAILIPALLGYINKAREKQITTDANAAYVAAQAILDENYGLRQAATVKRESVVNLTDINDTAWNASFIPSTTTDQVSYNTKTDYIIKNFQYSEKGKVASWDITTGNWEVGTGFSTGDSWKNIGN